MLHHCGETTSELSILAANFRWARLSRNISRESARGDIHCQWDDDDLHHPERLERQFDYLLLQAGCEAVCLQETMQFFPRARALYCTNWRAVPPTKYVFRGAVSSTRLISYALHE